jgi:uncharacterized peroxidase-related enzyme
MAYINTGIDQPGIVELLFYKGSTGKALSDLTQTLMYGPSNLSTGERELIAAYVSKLNNCDFCHNSHTAAANVHLQDNGEIIGCVIEDINTSPVSEKMKGLLKIAQKVQVSGKSVSAADIKIAKDKGANDEDIHDAVLIAAAFCMFNRYVDGLGTAPAKEEEYREMGQRLAKVGYKYPPAFLRKLVIWIMARNKSKKEKR